MPTIERDGARIAYDVTGDGPAVVLGHSLLCGRWMWRDVAPALARRYRVVNIAFRGHEDSTAPAAFSFADLVDDWLAVLDAEGIPRAALVGLSMGGMTGMRLALKAPDRVAALTLIDSNPDRELAKNRMQYKLLTWLYAAFGFNRVLLRRVAPLMLAESSMRTRPDLVAALAREVRVHDRSQLIRAIDCVNGRSDAPPIEGIACPTLVLVGDQDVATPPARSHDIARRIPGAELVHIPDAGHLSALEQPHRVAGELRRFLDALSW